MKQRVYFFSGMGADRRAFDYLKIECAERVYFDWVNPLPAENLHQYALRMVSEQPPEPDDILLGLSLGGLIAQEIASVYPVKKVILVSSLRSGEALRPLFSAAEKIRLIDFFNEELLKKAIVKGARLVLPLNEKRIILIVEMLDQFDGVFYKWAMNEVLHWDGADCLCPVYHIHGDKDELFPVGNVKDAVIIKGGTHLMVTLRAEEISKTLKKWICDEF